MYATRLRYFSDDEMESTLALMEERYRCLAPLCDLSCETGLCLSELLRLTKRDVKLGNAPLLELQESKGNKHRSVPLTDRAQRACWELVSGLTRDHELVFPGINQAMTSYAMTEWKKRHGLPADDKACFHTLRHTCCSRLIQSGVNPVVAQKWMGHMNISTTMRYAHLAPTDLHGAAEMLENRVE